MDPETYETGAAEAHAVDETHGAVGYSPTSATFEKGHHQSHSADFLSPNGGTYTADGAPAELELHSTSSSRFPTPPVNENDRPHSSASASAYTKSSFQDPDARASTTSSDKGTPARHHVVIKVGMVGDAQIGKTSLMVKYVEGEWDEDYIQTLGVNFMEKTISIRNNDITFSIWDLGGQREFVNMLPLVCNDAVAILFMFDLTRKSTLNSIKEWYRQGRGFNKTAIPFLVGTKYDQFINMPSSDQEEITAQV